jgi:hypothetical protein
MIIPPSPKHKKSREANVPSFEFSANIVEEEWLAIVQSAESMNLVHYNEISRKIKMRPFSPLKTFFWCMCV